MEPGFQAPSGGQEGDTAARAGSEEYQYDIQPTGADEGSVPPLVATSGADAADVLGDAYIPAEVLAAAEVLALLPADLVLEVLEELEVEEEAELEKQLEAAQSKYDELDSWLRVDMRLRQAHQYCSEVDSWVADRYRQKLRYAFRKLDWELMPQA